MKLRFNFLALDTFHRLLRTNDFINLLDDVLPTKAWQETEALKKFAESEGWDYGDYQAESQALDEKLHHWMPRLAAYSCIILLYSVVENQLQAYAEQVGKKQNSSFCVQDLRGHGVRQVALYLSRVAGIDLTKDPDWADIERLRELRNLIVHAGGKPSTKEQQTLMKELLDQYPGKVSLDDSYWPPHGQIWISMNLCSELGNRVEAFFRRLFKTAGFSEKSSEFVD